MNYKGYGGRSNNEFKRNDYWKLGADISIRRTQSDDPTRSGGGGTVNGTGIEALMREAPIYATKYSNGYWGGGYSGGGTARMLIEEKLHMMDEEWQETLGIFRVALAGK